MRIVISGRASLPLAYLSGLAPQGVEAFQVMGISGHPLYNTDAVVCTLFVDQAARRARNVRYVPVPYAHAAAFLRDLPAEQTVVACAYRDGRVYPGLTADVFHALIRRDNIHLEINTRMPVLGQGVDIRRCDVRSASWVEYDPPEYIPRASSWARPIAENVAGLIPQGAYVQLGVGAVPETVAELLGERGGTTGIWTEAFTDTFLHVMRGCTLPARPVASFVWGTRRLYSEAESLDLDMRPLADVNTGRGLRGPLFSVISALQVGRYGEVNTEIIGPDVKAGMGGALDFAHLAPRTGGAFIVAVPSERILLDRSPDAVTIPAALADYVVTERGVVRLRGVPLDRRPQLLRAVAGEATTLPKME